MPVLSGGGLVTMALGLRGHEDTSMGTVAEELKLAAELGLRTSVHTGSDGTARPVADHHEHRLLRDTTTFVHGNGIDDDELRMLADAGSSVSISPDVELKMGFGWPLTGLLEFATVDGAQACGLGARTGSITPGKDADVILLRADDLTVFPVTDPAATIVSAGHPGLVDTILVAGRIVKRDGVLVDVDLPALSPDWWNHATGSRRPPAFRSTARGVRGRHRSNRAGAHCISCRLGGRN